MSIERVREYLKQFNAEGRIREFPVSTATVELAAQAAGVEPGRIAKSLSFKLEDRTILVVAALVAEGVSQVSGLEHIRRGYEDLEGQLTALGAEVRLIH